MSKAVPDFDTLQAIVTHRYDVMTRYMRSLKQVCADEARRLKAAHGPALDARALRRWVLRVIRHNSRPNRSSSSRWW